MSGDRARFKFWRYAVLVAVPLLAVAVAYYYLCWGPPTTVLLVRHADRQGSADALSPAGIARAQELAHVMEKSGISALYHSEAARTQQTAEPTATLLELTPVVIAAADVVALVDDIRAHHTGQTVLVVGHSDTVPQIIAEFAGPAVTIPGDEFDNLYVLAVCRCRWSGLGFTNSQYGAASP